jgi:RimJ/RimL family protein N-acetyltransferase
MGLLYMRRTIYCGNSCEMRFVEINDAERILELRQDEQLARFLSKVDASVEAQRAWIETYKVREAEGKEFYFSVWEDGVFVGTTRIYHVDYGSGVFTGGSWICKGARNTIVPIESILATYSFAFDGLGLDVDFFDVRKGNSSVLAFHKRNGGVFVAETELDYLGIRTKKAFIKCVEKMKRIIPIERFNPEAVSREMESLGISFPRE